MCSVVTVCRSNHSETSDQALKMHCKLIFHSKSEVIELPLLARLIMQQVLTLQTQ